MKVEPVKEYKRDADGVRDLLGTAQFLSQASFIPTPVETSQVNKQEQSSGLILQINMLITLSTFNLSMPVPSDCYGASFREGSRQAS